MDERPVRERKPTNQLNCDAMGAKTLMPPPKMAVRDRYRFEEVDENGGSASFSVGGTSAVAHRPPSPPQGGTSAVATPVSGSSGWGGSDLWARADKETQITTETNHANTQTDDMVFPFENMFFKGWNSFSIKFSRQGFFS